MNNHLEKIYCFDSSVFISLNRIHSILPIQDFWIELENLFKSGKIISHEYVFDELNPKVKNPDFIANWVKDKNDYFINITDIQIQFVEKILGKFPDFIDFEKEKNQADPWIIALALERKEDVTLFGQNKVIYVVSQEKLSSPKKIPAISQAFDIPHMNLNAFLKDNGWRFGIIKE